MDNGVPVLAVVIHHVNVIQVRVCPVNQLLDYIQCHSCGLLDFIIHQPGPVSAVHVAALHLGHVPIVGEEEHSAEEKGFKKFVSSNLKRTQPIWTTSLVQNIARIRAADQAQVIATMCNF